MALIKNQVLTLTVMSSGANGEGVSKYDGMVIFIPFAIAGEKVKARIILVKKKYAVAKIIEVLTPAEERVRPECPVFGKCGGCQFQHLKYQNQIKQKSNIVKETLYKIAKIEFDVAPCIKSENNYRYRNKLVLPVAQEGEDLITGFYASNSHRIVPIDSCTLHSVFVSQAVQSIKDFALENGIKGYQEKEHTGVLRHIIIKEFNDQIMIILVINSDNLDCKDLTVKLSKLFTKYSLYLNVNKEVTNVVTGSKYIHISGEEFIKDSCLGIKYEIGPQSFMQINCNVRDKLYQKVNELIATNFDENFDLSANSCMPVCIDAYSGAGILSAILTKSCKLVYAIEIVAEAVEDANKLKEINNLGEKLININADCAKELPELVAKLSKEKLVLVLDPPRKGCEKSIIKSILKSKPEKIVYISCNPATLARDLGYLTGNLDINEENPIPIKNNDGTYQVTYIQPFDMFPQTKHVETVVLMSRTKD